MKKVPSTHLKNILYMAIPAAIATGMLAGYLYGINTTEKDIDACLSQLYRIERDYIENIPIYSDHVTPQMEKKLRTYLLQDHLRVARSKKIHPISSDSDVKEYVKKNIFVELKPGAEDKYYFYNVPKKYRFSTEETKSGLIRLTERFQAKLKSHGDLPPVKLAISSMLRPMEYQKDLKSSNRNASAESTHSYGVSFDIFYDDYYPILPQYDDVPWMSRTLFEQIRTRFGYMMGDSLRRQFRSILFDTLLELQEEGIIYAIYEQRQRCYHVTVL